MADDNSIKISIDDSEANARLDALIKKTKQLRGVGASDLPGAAGQQHQNVHVQRMIDRQNEETKKRLVKLYEDQEKSLDRIIEKEKKLVELRRSGVLPENDFQTQRRQNDQEAIAVLRRKDTIGKAIGDGFDGGGGGNKGWDDKGGTKVPPNLRKMLPQIIAAVGTAMKSYGEAQLFVGTAKERADKAQSTTIQNILGEQTRLQSQRRGYENTFYGKERVEAMNMALNRMVKEQSKDKMSIIGGLIAKTGAGAAMGSMVPGLGTLAGGAIGLGKGVYDIAMDDRQRNLITGNMDEYNKFIGAKGADVYKQQLAVQKAKDPFKMQAQQYFERRKKQMMGVQRAFGLSDEQLFGGGDSLYNRATNAGFTEDVLERNMMGIQRAGGTTRAGKEGAVDAAKMARGLDLTNAASLMGRISGSTGGGGAESKDAIIRMYAEATRMGLDTSETRKVLDASTKIALDKGIDATDVQKIIQMSMPVKSERGVQAAANAMSVMRRGTTQMGGMRGQFAQRGLLDFMKGEGIEMSKQDRNEALMLFSGKDVGEMSLQDEETRGLLRSLGLSSEDLKGEGSDKAKRYLKQLRKISSESMDKNQRRTQARVELTKAREKLSGLEKGTQEYDEAQAEVDRLAKTVGAYGRAEEGGAYGMKKAPERKAEQLMRGKYSMGEGLEGRATEADIKTAEGKLDQKPERLVDKAMASAAKDAAAEIENFRGQIKELAGAFDNYKVNTKMAMLAKTLHELASNGELSKEALIQMSAQLAVLGGSIQTPYRTIVPTENQTGEMDEEG